ncbi:MAG TPA: DUF3592 domain-containing protein [Puia sp.]|jgi:hypothetical protein|nr:DUF3592 domain-containing protein [Puia sp.]
MSKTTLFLVLFTLFAAPFVTSRTIWLIHSQKAEGFMAFEGMGYAGDQITLSYSVLYFKHGQDKIWLNSSGNLHLAPGTQVTVRYQAGDPSDARVDTFIQLWGDTLVYGGIPLLILIAVFLHPEVIPRRSKVRLTWKRPFIKLI